MPVRHLQPGLDGQPLLAPLTGVGHYTRQLVQALARLGEGPLRVELIRADYVEALKAQLAEKDARSELLERLLAEKETRLGERDEQIASLRRRVRALADVD